MMSLNSSCQARHSCQLCSKKFAKKGDLKSHQKVHGKAFACKECGKKYTSQDALDLHLEWKHKKGSNSSGFPCQVCGKVCYCNLNQILVSHFLKIHFLFFYKNVIFFPKLSKKIELATSKITTMFLNCGQI